MIATLEWYGSHFSLCYHVVEVLRVMWEAPKLGFVSNGNKLSLLSLSIMGMMLSLGSLVRLGAYRARDVQKLIYFHLLYTPKALGLPLLGIQVHASIERCG